MQFLKKYLTEGMIQVAILLSMCGVRVDVGLGPYLPNSWPDRIPGPTSALTQTQFHKLRNRLEEDTGLQPKNVDLEGFFTTRRLLGWVRSLDRLQVPQAELETWLVQQDPSPLPVRLLQQPSPVERGPDRLILPVEPRAGWDNPQVEQEDNGRESSLSLQECLMLLGETFPFSEEQQAQAYNAGDRTGDMQHPTTGGEPMLSPILTDGTALDIELEWQDLLAIMEPQSTDVDMLTIPDQDSDPNPSRTILQPLHQSYHSPEAEQEVSLLDTYLHLSVLEPSNHSDQDSALLPLMRSDELTNCSLQREDTLKPFHLNDSHNPPSNMDLLEESQENFCMGPTADPDHFNLCPEDLVDNAESYVSSFLLDEEDIEDIKGPLSDILVDATMLEEMNLLNLVLEEGFSPEMTARLEEEGYLDSELTHRTSQLSLSMDVSEERDSGLSESSTMLGEDCRQTVNQDGEDEAYSDSGLSLDSSHSSTSLCESEASSYSSSSSSLSVSSVVSEEDANEGRMELDITIKQEPEDVELGAVGGEYYVDDVKKLYPPVYEDQKLFNGFPWLEQISHDHTYYQPRSSASGLSPKISTKHSKSSRRHEKPYRLLSSKQSWGRDERRARALKIPFSNELIVNLPVEEFNDLLANYQLDEEQLSLVRDIRRRGKNKIAAQNCRKRKMDTLVSLDRDVLVLRRHRSRLFREKQDSLRTLQDQKQRLSALYQDVFSRLRDEEGRALNVNEYLLSFGPNGSISVVSRTPRKGRKSGKKHKEKKK